VEVLLEREHPAGNAALDFIVSAVEEEQRGCLISVFRSTVPGVPIGSHASMTADGAVAFLGDARWGLLFGPEELALARHVLQTGRAQILVIRAADGVIHVLLEPVMPPPRLFICGEGPDAVPLARFARDLGWNVVIWASSPRWLSRERFHGLGELSTGTVDQLRAAIDASARPAAVVLSHQYERDRELLGGLLRSKTSYIGVLGPRARALRILADLDQSVRALDLLGRVRAPVGLDIGAETPREIALSVLAEIQAALNGSSALPLSRRVGPIHVLAAATTSKPNLARVG